MKIGDRMTVGKNKTLVPYKGVFSGQASTKDEKYNWPFPDSKKKTKKK